MAGIRARLVVRFREVLVDRIERLHTGFTALQVTPADSEIAISVKREVHTVKGEARMAGFKAVSRVAHDIEGLLGGLAEEVLPAARVVAVFAGFDLIESLAGREPETPETDDEVITWRALAREAIEGTSAGLSVPMMPFSREPAALAPPVRRPIRAPSTEVELEKLDRLSRMTRDMAGQIRRNEATLVELQEGAKYWRRDVREIGPLVARLERARVLGPQQLAEAVDRLVSHVGREALYSESMDAAVRRAVEQDFALSVCASDLEDRVKDLRFVPLSSLFERFPIAVRDIAGEQGKLVRMETTGGLVEMDKRVIDRVSEPLLHLVRNAVDHGIEFPEDRGRTDKPLQALIQLSATVQGNEVEVVIRDDGRGIDVSEVRAALVWRGDISAEAAMDLSDEDLLDRIFDPEFSTRTDVTTLSGRGVGLAIVRDTVEQLGGRVRVQTVAGQSATFTIRIPTSVIVAPILVVRTGDLYYAMIAEHVVDAVEFGVDEGLERVHLRDILGLFAGSAEPEQTVIAFHKGRNLAIGVDEILGRRQAMQRPLDPFLGGVKLFCGSVVLDNGEPAMMLSIDEVFRLSRETTDSSQPPTKRRARVLVVDDSEFTRELVVDVFEKMGLEVIEAEDGRRGVDRFKAEAPDLVFTDLDMPMLDGFGLIQEIRGLGSEVPIIVFTTRGTDEARQRALDLGADIFLLKTEFRERKLHNIVDKYVEITVDP